MKLFLAILFLSTTFTLSQNVNNIKKIEIDTSQASSPVLIERAFIKKRINLNQRVLYLSYFLYDYSKLPKKFKSKAIEKCGTWVDKIIFFNLSKLNAETKKIVNSLRNKIR